MVQLLLLNRKLPHNQYFLWAYCYSAYEWTYCILDKWFDFLFWLLQWFIYGSHLWNDMTVLVCIWKTINRQLLNFAFFFNVILQGKNETAACGGSGSFINLWVSKLVPCTVNSPYSCPRFFWICVRTVSLSRGSNLQIRIINIVGPKWIEWVIVSTKAHWCPRYPRVFTSDTTGTINSPLS